MFLAKSVGVCGSMSTDDRALIGALIELQGGIRRVARATGLDHSTLAKWLKGEQATLSAAKVALLRDAIGLPEEMPDDARVHVWSPRMGMDALRRAVSAFFPQGAAVARSPWSAPNRDRLRNLARLTFPAEVYGLYDGRRRAVVRNPPGVFLDVDTLPGLRWNGPAGARSLRIDDAERDVWMKGTLDLALFDAAWPGSDDSTDAEVIAVIRALGLSNRDAIGILRESVAEANPPEIPPARR